MATSDYPNMTAPQGLLPETARSEGGYEEVRNRLNELQRHFKLQELHELAALKEELRIIDTEFEHQLARLAASPLRDLFVEQLLRKEKENKVVGARRIYQERKDMLEKRYNDDRQRYKKAAYEVITALMNNEPGLGSVQHPILSTFRAVSTPVALQTPASVSPSPAHNAFAVPSQAPREFAPLPVLTTQVTPKIEGQPYPLQNGVFYGPRGPPSGSVSGLSRGSPAESLEQTRIVEPGVIDLVSPAQSPEPSRIPGPTVEEDTSISDSTISVGGFEQPPAAANPPAVADPDPVLKRKANGEFNGESPIPNQGPAKRTKLPDKASGSDGIAVDQPPRWDDQKSASNTISFEEVYGPPPVYDEAGNEKVPPGHRMHIIVHPSGNGKFYILRCDEHGVHFGAHPLRGAAKHLHSAQHGYMSKAHATAIATLGHLVLNCTEELMARNNERVAAAFDRGVYRVFNANNLSQTKRAELGYPPLDPPSSQKTAAQRMGGNGWEPSPSRPRKPFAGVVSPASCKFYLGSQDESRYPVLILPWGDLSPAGLQGALSDTGLFKEPMDRDGKPMGRPKLPKCYVYEQDGGRICAIKDWASGYDSLPLLKKREFPVLCFDGPTYTSWNVGWIDAASLSELDFDDPRHRKIPYVEEAWKYYNHFVVPQIGRASRATGTSTPQQGAYVQPREHHDTEMRDAGDEYSNGPEPNPEVSDSESTRDARNHMQQASADSGRVLPSERAPRQSPDVSQSPATHAQIIAAQALGLPAPARTGGFTAVNFAPSASAPVSRSASTEPPSRADSVSSAGAGHRRVVKIHASSKSPLHTDNGHSYVLPSMVLPERPADGSLPRGASPSQPSTESRRPSPASLENIVQDFPSEGSSLPQQTEAQNPQMGQSPLPSIVTESAAPQQLPSFIAINTKDAQHLRESRAESAPVQPREPSEEEKQRSGIASADTVPARQAVSESPALASQEQPPRPQAITIPPPSASLPQIPAFNLSPVTNLSTLTTPTASALNTRANSPSLPLQQQTKSGTPTVSFTKSETPTLLSMDVFDVGVFMENDVEKFTTTVPGEFLRLIDDHQSGVLRTADDAPVSVTVEPKKVKVVERSPTSTGATCVVKLTYHAVEGEEEGEGRTQTLVFEKARSTASGLLNGVVHARRFCRRMQTWNQDVDCPAPSAGSDSSINWRPQPDSRGGSAAPGTPAASTE